MIVLILLSFCDIYIMTRVCIISNYGHFVCLFAFVLFLKNYSVSEVFWALHSNKVSTKKKSLMGLFYHV